MTKKTGNTDLLNDIRELVKDYDNPDGDGVLEGLMIPSEDGSYIAGLMVRMMERIQALESEVASLKTQSPEPTRRSQGLVDHVIETGDPFEIRHILSIKLKSALDILYYSMQHNCATRLDKLWTDEKWSDAAALIQSTVGETPDGLVADVVKLAAKMTDVQAAQMQSQEMS